MNIRKLKDKLPELVEFSDGHWGFPELVPYGENYGFIFEMMDWDGSKYVKDGTIDCMPGFRCCGTKNIQAWGTQTSFRNEKRFISYVKKLHQKALAAIEECKDFESNCQKECFWKAQNDEERWEKIQQEILSEKSTDKMRFTSSEKKLALAFNMINEGFDKIKARVNGRDKWLGLEQTKGKFAIYVLVNFEEYATQMWKPGKHTGLEKKLYYKFDKAESAQIFAQKCYHDSVMRKYDADI